MRCDHLALCKTPASKVCCAASLAKSSNSKWWVGAVSLRLEMLQVARLAPKALGESADLVRDFLHSQWNEDGGFRGRDGASDLYYTVFGIEGLLALRAELPFEQCAAYLRRIGVSDELDFIHLACLARCWAA